MLVFPEESLDIHEISILDYPDFRQGRKKWLARRRGPLRENGRNVVSRSGDFKKDEVRFHATVRCPSPRFKRLVMLATPFPPSELLITSDRAWN
jgi:hypothetical protein